jgi:hypothetical protein
MTVKPGVVLAMTVHDPERRLYASTARFLPSLKRRYVAIVALCSPTTNSEVAALLAQHDVHVAYQRQAEVDTSILGQVRLDTIRMAHELGYRHCQLADHDRILHWVANYSQELDQIIAQIPQYDFLVLGRTPRAFRTHPPAQQDTEKLATHAFALAWGEAWDITAGSRGLSRRAIKALLADSQTLSVGNDGEWPLVLRQHPELQIGYQETEGLEFETADRYADEIAALGSIEAWIKARYNTLNTWESRIHTAHLIVQAIRQAAERQAPTCN